MAVRVLPGESRDFTVRDLTQPGVGPITSGAVVTFDLLDAAGAVQATALGASGGTDDWTGTLTVPTTEGAYTLRVTVVYLGETRYQTEGVEVRALLNQGGTTLAALRRDLANRLGDHLLCTASQAGTTSLFYDNVRLRRSDDAYAGSEAYVTFAAADNVGLSRDVQGSDQAATSITLQPAVAAAFAQGDRLELHNHRGIGWMVAEKHDALNSAIRQAMALGGVELSAVLTADFDQDDPVLAVPGAFEAVYAVAYRPSDDDQRWTVIPRARALSGPGWRAHRDAGTVEVQGSYRWAADGRPLKLFGFGRHDDLSSDEDATLVNANFVVLEAGYQLLAGAGADRHPEKAQRLLPEFRNERAVWRRAATRIRPAGTSPVRTF